MRIFVITQILLASLALQASAQDFEAGRKAANCGDFVAALENWQPLAEAGDSAAQYSLGRMYARGDGVKRDFKKAFELFRRSAEQGNKQAAEKLALMYERGDGAPKDIEESAFWRKVSEGRANPPLRVAPAATVSLDSRPGSSFDPAPPAEPIQNDYTAAPPPLPVATGPSDALKNAEIPAAEPVATTSSAQPEFAATPAESAIFQPADIPPAAPSPESPVVTESKDEMTKRLLGIPLN